VPLFQSQFPYVSTALPPPNQYVQNRTNLPLWPGVDNAAGLLINSPNSPASFFKSSDTKRSYLLRITANRDVTHPMGAGGVGVDDAAIYAQYRSFAADGTGVQQRGINASSRHSGTTGNSIGNLISTNAGTTVTLNGDDVALTCVNEDYALATGGVSGVLDLLHLHEGADAVGGEFGIRIRNQKKNGSQIGSFIKIQNDAPATTMFKHGLDMQEAADAGTGVSTLLGDVVLGTKDANGLPAIIASGDAVNDAAIVAQVGADTLWADGSLYISVLDGAGTLWQKRNDVWTSI
jgi:hypothetical protein